MKQELFKSEFDKLFNWFTTETTPNPLRLGRDFYKHLWKFLLVGDSYYFIMNHHNISFDFVSKEVREVLGYSKDEFDIECLNKNLHPDDQPWFLAFGHKMIDFFSRLPVEKLMKYKLRYDIRYRKKNGDYVRILYQGVIVELDENSRLLRSLAVHTDITYLKQEGKPVLSFIGMDGEPSYIDVGTKNIFVESKDELSTREKEVLKLLIEGKPSKQISDILHISKQTVDTHRKNMLRKNHLNNTGELIGKAIRYGWL